MRPDWPSSTCSFWSRCIVAKLHSSNQSYRYTSCNSTTYSNTGIVFVLAILLYCSIRGDFFCGQLFSGISFVLPFALDALWVATPHISQLYTAAIALCHLKQSYPSTSIVPHWANLALLLLYRHVFVEHASASLSMGTMAALRLLIEGASPSRVFSSASDNSFSFRLRLRGARYFAFDLSYSPYATVVVLPCVSFPAGSFQFEHNEAVSSRYLVKTVGYINSAPFNSANFDASILLIRQFVETCHLSAALQLLQVRTFIHLSSIIMFGF